ncbi:hypothetical protein AMTR_s03795p00007310 [Amborella trichopoda]|uniref:Uncharacterized protein n=1 Tax=Amborella trichopoda TaxID=13333 RepID=U5CUS7_AMBTC|nr:hypothetical protein AMTR_s03795p00007310 [Amborella trichopoda]
MHWILGDYRRTQRAKCFNLVRMMKLLAPLLEEVGEMEKPLPDEAIASFFQAQGGGYREDFRS